MRKLGRTGAPVSELGAGTWGLGSAEWRDVEPREAQRALYAAIDAGVSFVDTAPAYGDSERLVGEVIRDLRARDRVVVATQVAPLSRAGPGGVEAVYPSAYVVRSVEDSLRAQRAEVLPIAQLQWRDAWLETAAWRDLRGTMQALIKAGKVLRWGVSAPAHDPAAAVGVMSDPLIETVQAVYNLFDPRAADELFVQAREHQVGVIARAPFDEGALTGDLTPETAFPPGDVRNRYFAGDRLAQVVDRVDALRAFVGQEVDSLPELALRFCLSHPDVATVVAGMRRPEHVRQNIAVTDGRALSAALLERLRDHAWDRSWYA